MPSDERTLRTLRSWFDSWVGIGHTPVGMARRGNDKRHTSYYTRKDPSGWRLVLVAAALFDTVALAGCATEGTTRILSYYGDWSGVKPGQRPAPHRGIDFDVSKGDPVIAATDGTVVRVLSSGNCGNGVVVQHTVDGRTLYCHMDETNVRPDQKVKRGDVLGKAGTTGHSLGVPHLHFGLLQRQPSGEYSDVNPLPFIVGCFDPAKTAAYSALEDGGEKPHLVLTYPVRCASNRIK